MNRLWGVAWALVLPVIVPAQSVDHALIASRADVPSVRRDFAAGSDTVDVLAVMVQFQQDSDQRTSGDGRFDLSTVTAGDVPIDAPPRNAAYFEHHLEFLSSYFRQVSKGKVILRHTVIPQVITLPDIMGRYSPAKNSPNAPVADLARDAWRKADTLGLFSEFSRYDAFVVFHAGVGRDIDLVSSLGYDPTPLDIPSLYLGSGAFQEAHGSAGIPVQGGAFIILNSIVLPETESRTLSLSTGDVFLEFGINGLLCASFGNYLGLPDLFDTKTGRTAIGRFGLMDGESLFSFGGVFPPEPSAWEKYWLGWIEPVTVPHGSSVISLPAVALADTIYRVPIGAREYYLVENRNRDPQRNGQRITMVDNGATVVKTFARDTAGFNAYDVTSLAGSITQVEDFDWSLPGGVDDEGAFYDGGILIWHIDENVIASRLSSNSINADIARRGVDLEEADGSQDIGREYAFLSSGGGSESGTALDFWYQGNNSPVNKNRFAATTFPATLSNDGAIAHVTMEEFSGRGPRMSVRVTVGDGNITPLAGFPKQTRRELPANALTVAPLGSQALPAMIVTTSTAASPEVRRDGSAGPLMDARIFAWGADGKQAWSGGASDGSVVRAEGVGRGFLSGVTVTDLDGDDTADLLAPESGTQLSVRAVSLRDANTDSIADTRFNLPAAGISATHVIPGATLLAAGGDKGRVRWISKDGGLISSELVLADSTASVAGVSKFAGLHSFVFTGTDGSVAIRGRIFPNGVIVGDRTRNLGHAIAGPAATAVNDTSEQVAVATTDGWVYLLKGNLDTTPGFPVKAGDRVTDPPAFGDVDGDGRRDIVVFSGRQILAWNAAGVLLDNFPITLPTEDTLFSSPVLGDVNGDGVIDIVGGTTGGLVFACDKSGKTAPGFPLLAGNGKQSVAVFTSTDSIIVAVASGADGSLSAWLTGRATLPVDARLYPWAQYQRDAEHTGVDASVIALRPLSAEFFPPSRAYNWPNPAYDGKTMIRYYVRESAAVQIKIYDMAGDLVTSFPAPGAGGLDNEVVWDLSQVQSGVYFAHIEASSPGGSGSTVVKIAVVK